MQIIDSATGNTDVLNNEEIKMIVSAVKTVIAINQVSVDIGNDKDGKALQKVELANRVLHKLNHIGL